MSDARLQHLMDRAAISDVVLAYATALDRLDFELFRSLYADTVEIDYRSIKSDLFKTFTRDAWVTYMRNGFGGFDATQHISSNHVHVIEGDQAECVSYMQASHFLVRDGITACAMVYGYYTNRLIRTAQGWKLRHITLSVTAMTGDLTVLGEATERLRAKLGRASA